MLIKSITGRSHRHNVLFFLMLFALATLVSCGRKPQPIPMPATASDTLTTDSTATPIGMNDPDSTIYGRADGFGQGGLTLIADDGHELELTLTGGDNDATPEHYAVIDGDREDTARYAVTIDKADLSVQRLINISQLERLVPNYRIHNGRLFLMHNGRYIEVDIQRLDDHQFVGKDTDGNIYQWHR